MNAWKLALTASLAADQQWTDPRYSTIVGVSYELVQIPDEHHLQASNSI